MASVPNILQREPREKTANLWKWAALFLMFGLSLALFYSIVLRPSSDLSIHATWAAEGDFRAPRSFLHHGLHPLWHGFVALVMLTGVSVKWAAALVTAAFKTIELWLIHRVMTQALGDSVRRDAITLAALCCALVSAVCIPWINPTIYLGIGTPNTWHSPTQMISMVMMLLCVPYTAHCYGEFERLVPLQGDRTLIPWRKAVALSLLLLLSLIAKPTLMQAFLPAAGIYFLCQWIRHPKSSRFFGQMILAVLPSVLFMALQYLFYFGYIVPSQGRMIFEFSLEKAGEVLRSMFMMQGFALYALFLCVKRKDWKDPLLCLTVLLNAVGFFEFLLLGEDGRRAADGNFGWAMMGGALMLWVIALPKFLKAFSQERKSKKRFAYYAGFLLLTWHLASGIEYILYLFTTTNPL